MKQQLVGDPFDGRDRNGCVKSSKYETTRKLTSIEKWVDRDFRAIVEYLESRFGGFVCHCGGLEILFDCCWRID